MALLLALLFFIAIPAAASAALAGMLAVRKPGWTKRRRTAVAALVAGLVPVVLPIVSVLRGNDGGVGSMVPTVALLILGLLMALVVGLPVALWAVRGRQDEPVRPNTFD